MYIHLSVCICESHRRFFLLSPLNILHTLFVSPPSLIPSARPALICSDPLLLPSVCPVVRHSSAVRRKTVWQCGQMHRVYVPGRVSSCPSCAAVARSVCPVVRSVARSVASVRPSARVCVSCCRVSSGGSNRRYASISRAAAIRCSVWSVMLLLSIWIYTFCRVCPRRFASSTMPIPAAFMCSRM